MRQHITKVEVSQNITTQHLGNRKLPFSVDYDLAHMEGSAKITFPKRLGGASVTREHKGISGSMALRFEESETPGVVSVTLEQLEVTVGQIRLPIGHGRSKSVNMVNLRLVAPEGRFPEGSIDRESGEMSPLEVSLEADGLLGLDPLRLASGRTIVTLKLSEKFDLQNGSLIGTGVGAIVGGLLAGTIMTFAHKKKPPPPPPCGQMCNCRGQINDCPHQHVHCPQNHLCNGRCTLPQGHGGAHSCSHNHPF